MNRSLRRMMNKRGVDLSNVLHGIQEVTTGLKATLPETKRELAGAQEYLRDIQVALFDATYAIQKLRYELDRQRAVFLRMFANQVVGDDPQQLLVRELEYSAEYDAMQFCCWIATLAE
jgi:hypothetical protein